MSKLLLLILSMLSYCVSGQVNQLQTLKEAFAYYPDNKFIICGETHSIDVANEILLETIKQSLNKGKTLHVLFEMGKSQERF